ncbi:MAG: hypothetical protein ACHQ53_08090 [Polyangiales bacterium]
MWKLGCAVVLVALAACGGSAPASSTAPTVATASGNEAAEPAAEPASPGPEAAPAPAPAGPAVIAVEAKVHGKTVAASIELLGEDGQPAASGKSGEPIRTQSGEYEMRVSIADAAALLDKPTQRKQLTLHAGDDLHEVVEFPWAMIQLNVVINGRPTTNASVKLMRQGAEVGTLKSGADFVPISPGKYEAEVKAEGASIAVHGLMFPDGATQTVPVNVQL